ncbi:MAG: tryptophanase [Elusimicrobia bacterium]|nr:MAG: tryptophanase [Elusimicrobiota bacterium]
MAWKTIIEPFRIKSVEPLGFTSPAERERLLREGGYNLFNIPANKVLIDLLTDSGTSAMSAEQWAAMMRGDESYAGATSFYRFEKAVRELTGLREIIPVHQGRAAERILFEILGGPGKVVLANSHFDTTRANVEVSGAEARDLTIPEASKAAVSHPFKGNMDTLALEGCLKELGDRVPLVIMTVTNNSVGGQPVSMANLRETARLCREYKVPLFLDCARFAENAWLIKKREPGFASLSPKEISKEMFSYCQGAWMSSKKDALVNMGGFLALSDGPLAKRAREVLIIGEGFTTYGGLSGRDLEAVAVGLTEVLDEEYLAYRIRSIEYLAEGLRRAGVPIVEPPGGHGVYVDAKAFLPHIPAEKYPAQALACHLYLLGGIRTVEIGSLMFGKRGADGTFKPARAELVRLAVPRRVYTQSHIDYVIEVFGELARRGPDIRGLTLIEASEHLSHFTAKLAPAAA